MKTLEPIHIEIAFGGHMFLFVLQMCRKSKYLQKSTTKNTMQVNAYQAIQSREKFGVTSSGSVQIQSLWW